MVHDKFFVVLAWLFQPEGENKQLLAPIRKLDQVVHFHLGLHIPVRIVYIDVLERLRRASWRRTGPEGLGVVPVSGKLC